VTSDKDRIYFSDWFDLPAAVVTDYGAFDVSLINDLPLFIDPFLLFNSSKSRYKVLHNQIINYLLFLRDKAVRGALDDGLIEAWFTFHEVKQNWLGYSLEGNHGTGLGKDFAYALSGNLASLFASFGSETVTRGSHLEKICLIGRGVGKDNISDFATNLIKGYLLEFTQTFARQHLRADQRRLIPIPKVAFSYQTESWMPQTFELPYVNGDYVLLTPVDLLTKDEVWINKRDVFTDFSSVVESIPNDQIRAQLDNFFRSMLTAIQDRDEEEKARRRKPSKRKPRRPASPPEPTRRQRAEAIGISLREHPEFIDYYIRWKEDHGDDAQALADEHLRASARLYISQVRRLALTLRRDTNFYDTTGSTREEALKRIEFLKDVIENKGGWRLFYVNGEPLRRESDMHIIFRLTWCNTPSDVNREVDNGRGPSDFEVSRGRFDKSIVEFKLAKNTSLAKNLQFQAEAYKKASDAQHALKVIVYFTNEELGRTNGILRTLGLEGHADITLIDARNDNKPSASRVAGTDEE
jgi:hypothetical protein